MMPATARPMATGAKAWEAAGKSGTANRMSPYPPVFRSRPARITLPAVGASVCASGSQVCSGNAGSFTAKAAKKPEHQEHAHHGGHDRAHELLVGECPGARGHAVEHGQADDGDEHQEAADLREEEELHRGLVPVLVAPDVDEEVHRDQHELPEEGEEEQVRGKEDAVHAREDQGKVEVEEGHPLRDALPGGEHRHDAEEAR